MKKFEDLDVWKQSARLCAEMYKSLSTLKDFGFRDQLTKAGLSIPSNIAEGVERISEREKAYFLNIAKGSAGAVRAQIYIGMEVGFIDKILGEKWVEEATEISKMLQSFISDIKNSQA